MYVQSGTLCVHVRAGLPIRQGAGGGLALIPANCTSAAPGTHFDLISGGIEDAWDYDAMDTMSLFCLPHRDQTKS